MNKPKSPYTTIANIFLYGVALCGFVFCVFIMLGCSLKPIEAKKYQDYSHYKYAYINPTQIVESGIVGDVYTNMGYTPIQKSMNPSDIIAGILMKKGFYIVNDVASNPSQTFIVSYGQGGKRKIAHGFGGYTLEVSIQILDAQTKEPIFTCTAEGQETSVIEIKTPLDYIRVAINRCLSEF